MKLSKAKLVTIICDNILDEKIISDIKSLGIKGYSIMEIKGEGLNTKKLDQWSGGNSIIQTIANEEKALKLLDVIYTKYINKFSCIAYLKDVEVLREDRF